MYLRLNPRNNFPGQYWFGASNSGHERTNQFYWIDGMEVYTGFWIPGLQQPFAYKNTNKAVCMYFHFEEVDEEKVIYPISEELRDAECSDDSKYSICELERIYSACFEIFSNSTVPSSF
jgi:hypothetical protein